MREPIIAVTSGEPAGIGPDVCLDLVESMPGMRLVVLADRDLLRERAVLMGKTVAWDEYRATNATAKAGVEVLHVPLRAPCVAGQLDPRNSRSVLEMIDRAYEGCVAGEFDAMVTAPVNKAVINDAGIAFTGHTEYLAERAGGAHVVMMLVGGGLRVALATTHLALKEVAAAITATDLEMTIRVIAKSMREEFGLPSPRILVAGLNPHSGEDGHLGREEIDVIRPVIGRLNKEGFQVSGPVPADTLFNPARLKEGDCVLAMYHDQGLPVLKFASFGAGVNVTLGLPIVRTSVDHGTALDLAGSGRAESGSLREAIRLAGDIVHARREAVAAR